MKRVDSLDELGAAFAAWRRTKRHAREAMPEELLARARRATSKHGVKAVVGVTGVERARLFRTRPTRESGRAAARSQATLAPRSAPSYSRLELSAAPPPERSRASARPVAEVEMPSGMTLRVFEQSPEMMGLLSAVCGFGGAR